MKGILNDNFNCLHICTCVLFIDYEDAINLTSASSNINTSTITRNTGHGRALDTHERVVDSSYNRGRSLDKGPLPQAHAEDLQNSNPWASNDINVALISGVSFGALALVTLFGKILYLNFMSFFVFFFFFFSSSQYKNHSQREVYFFNGFPLM